MVVASKVLGSAVAVWLALNVSACGGPSCFRNSDCPQGQRCAASSCLAPGSGAGNGAGTGSAAGSSGGSAAGTGGQAGQPEADAGGQVNDSGAPDAGQAP